MTDPAPESYHGFISYSHTDADWVRTLAGNLHRQGLDVWFDEWETRPGDVLARALDKGLERSRNGILVIGHDALDKNFVLEEYAALWHRSVTEGIRLIPLILADVKLPPLMASRIWIDFRDPNHYDTNLTKLTQTLKQERAGRPARDGLTVRPDGARAEGTRLATLRIDSSGVELTLPDRTTIDEPAPGLPEGEFARMRAFETQRLRNRPDVTVRMTTGPDRGLVTGPGEIGRILRAGFVAGEVASALDGLVRETGAQLGSVRLGIETTDELSLLPWETLQIDGHPAALHPRINVHRVIRSLSPPPIAQIPRPLRILAVIASPDDGDGDLLDYERELETILQATEQVHARENAFVKILEFGNVEAITTELRQTRFHVLYLSGHAKPGAFIMEHADGRTREVTAHELVVALPSDRVPPMVVLAGCLTNRTGLSASTDEQAEESLPALGRTLAQQGVPVVLAMTAPVTDRFATELAGALFENLLTQDEPEPTSALAEARRRLEADRLALHDNHPEKRYVEWATPALITHGAVFSLFNPDSDVEALHLDPPPSLATSISQLGTGEFVGRRTQIRNALEALHTDRNAILIHGLGGVGKSTFGARLLRDLPGRIHIGVASTTVTPDSILSAVAGELHKRNEPVDTQHLAYLTDPEIEWRDRLDLVDRFIISDKRRIMLLLDNFEDALGEANGVHSIIHGELGDFLAAWTRINGCGLILTSRHPFAIGDLAERRTSAFHLGPLSLPETMKLVRRLRSLDQLSWPDKERAWQHVGGHPRTLEYLDAMLGGGEANEHDLSDAALDRFERVTERLDAAIRNAIGTDPATIMTQTKGDLDTAMSQAITLAADDVLLGGLMGMVDATPLGREVVLAVGVHRGGVDAAGLAFGLGDEIDVTAEMEAYQAARQTVGEALDGATSQEEANQRLAGLPEEVVTVAFGGPPPPRSLPDGVDAAVAAAERLGLVAPTAPGWVVHRWTADTLTAQDADHYTTEAVTTAHRSAADYYQWRTDVWPQDRDADIADLYELRYHRFAAGDLDAGLQAGESIASQLETWGRYGDAQHLMNENLTLAPDHPEKAAWLGQLGILAQNQGDYATAEDWYRKALTIAEELGNRAGLATGYHQLGMLAHLRGDYDAAEDWYRKALTIADELGNRAGIAASHGQLGILAHLRGDYAAAEDWYRQALPIFEELGDRAGIATSYHQLGMLAQDRGDYATAEDWYRKSLTIKEELGDRAGIAASHGQLGILAHLRGDYATAEDWYRQSLTIADELGNRAGLATGYHQLGMLAQDRGDYATAEDWYRKSLTIKEELGNRAGLATGYHQLGILAQNRGDYATAEDWYRQSLTIEEELGNRAGIATSYHQLGMLAHLRGDYDAAEDWYRKALTIADELGNRAGLAASHGQLGMLAHLRGDYDAAEDWYRQALPIFEELGDRAGIATSYHQLGMLAHLRGDYAAAEDWYRKALTIKEELGNRAGIATSYHQLGMLAQNRGDYPAAEDWYRQSLTINQELGNRAGLAAGYHQLGMLAHLRGDYAAAEDWYRQALPIFEELGNRAGIASTTSQLGVLTQNRGQPGAAIPFHLQALSIRLDIGSGEAGIDLNNLASIREDLGDEQFTTELGRYLDPDALTAVIGMLDQPNEEESND